MNFQRLRTLLERHYGWATEAIHDRELLNAVQAQALALSMDFKSQPDRVLSIICQDPKQLAKLAESLAVHETWFFRGSSQLQHAVDHLVSKRQQLALNQERVPLRILSAPCSTGEEAYSLAILLSQRGLNHRDVTIDGVDQSELAIQRARQGLYNQNSFRETGWEQPHMVAGIHSSHNLWQVDSSIASMVRLEVGNLLEMPAPLLPYDCIFCRNLLIYLSQPKRAELLKRLAQWLTPQGRIYVSAVEAPIAHEAGLTAIAPLELQVFSKSVTPAMISEPHPPAVRTKPRAPSTLTNSRSNLHTSAPSSSVAIADPVSTREPAAELTRAEQAADAGRFSEAEKILAALPPNERFTAAAQFLRGVIAQAQGKLDEAQYAWEQAVYLDPQHGPALQRLWLSATSRGDSRLAEQYRRRWLKRRVET
jgi:chemotaxis protein methyltransferase WspC